MNDFVRLLATGTTNRKNSLSRNTPQNGYYGSNFLEESILANIKDKLSISIKATPSKDAATTRKLAIKCGYLMKRNEQGVWQKRFICTVPHTFLYYFESEFADSPRGIIDLDFMTNITREDNVLKIATSMEDRNRAFYFDCLDNNDNLNEWILSLIRDRYHVLHEERNAYQQMQSEISGVINDASLMSNEKAKEKEMIEKELYESNKTCDEAIKILKGILVNIGITEDEMSNLTDVFKIGKAIQNGMIKFKNHSESRYEEVLKILDNERITRNEDLKLLEKKINIEINEKNIIESNFVKVKNEYEQKIKEFVCEIDNSNLNMQMAISSKNISDNKIATLLEQKKVLVKEVKLLRKKLDDNNNIINEMKLLNENLKLSSLSVEQQQQVSKSNSLDDISANTIKGSLSMESSQDGSISNENLNDNYNKNKTSLDTLIHSIDESGGTNNNNNIDSDTTKSNVNFTSNYLTNRLMSLISSSKVTTSNVLEVNHDLNYDITYKSDDSENTMAPGEIAWALSPIKSDKSDMVWIDQGKVNYNLETPNDSFSDLPPIIPSLNDSDNNININMSPSETSSKTSFFTGAFSILGQTTTDNKDKDVNSQQSQQVITEESLSSKLSPLTRFSSIFSSSISQKNTNNPQALLTEELLRDHESSNTITTTPDSTQTTNEAIDSNEHPSSLSKFVQGDIVKYICLKCSGTVEGPKLSTCKCSVPTLSKFIETRKSSIVDIFSKGSSVAGGLAGGLMKATTGLISTTRVQLNKMSPEDVHIEDVENVVIVHEVKDSMVSDLLCEYNQMKCDNVVNQDSLQSDEESL